MAPVRSLDHLVLRVRDLDRSLAFYQGLLSLRVEGLEQHRRGERPFVSLRVGESLLDLVPDPGYEPGPAAQAGLVHFCVTLGEFAATVRRLRAAGVPFLEDEPVARAGARGVAPSIYAQDPDGYVVELKEWVSP
jgi:catechol 2,3-dioxygenase-like lactoylglutathione lyase family enzyme